MKVIFLDVGGVLNSEDTFNRCRNNKVKIVNELDDKNIILLKELIDKTIVLSSSWRMSFINNKKDGLGYILIKKLKEFDIDMYNYTLYLSTKREYEIKNWLDSHIDVESFVILDDEDDMCELFDNNLVKTNFKYGLTKEDVDKAIKY